MASCETHSPAPFGGMLCPSPVDYPCDKIRACVITVLITFALYFFSFSLYDAGCGLDYGNHQHWEPEADRT